MSGFNLAIRRFWRNAFRVNARGTRSDLYYAFPLVILWEVLFGVVGKLLMAIHFGVIASLVWLIANVVIAIPFLTVWIRRLVDEGCTVLGAVVGIILFAIIVLILNHFMKPTLLRFGIQVVLFVVMTILPTDKLMTTSDVEIMKRLFRPLNDINDASNDLDDEE